MFFFHLVKLKENMPLFEVCVFMLFRLLEAGNLGLIERSSNPKE